MSSGSTTTDIYILLITFMVGFAAGCLVEYLRERWEERRMWLGPKVRSSGLLPKDPDDKSDGRSRPWTDA